MAYRRRQDQQTKPRLIYPNADLQRDIRKGSSAHCRHAHNLSRASHDTSLHIFLTNQDLSHRYRLHKSEKARQGDIEVAEGVSQDAYAIIFGNCGGGIVGGNLKGHRHMTHEETLAILKFHNVGAIDVVIAALNRLRQRVLTEEPVQILDEQGRLIEVVKPILNGKTNDSP